MECMSHVTPETLMDKREDSLTVGRVIGRMTNGAGQRIVIRELEFEAGDCEHSVWINGDRVFCDLDCRPRAVEVARWWMAGCPS